MAGVSGSSLKMTGGVLGRTADASTPTFSFDDSYKFEPISSDNPFGSATRSPVPDNPFGSATRSPVPDDDRSRPQNPTPPSPSSQMSYQQMQQAQREQRDFLDGLANDKLGAQEDIAGMNALATMAQAPEPKAYPNQLTLGQVYGANREMALGKPVPNPNRLKDRQRDLDWYTRNVIQYPVDQQRKAQEEQAEIRADALKAQAEAQKDANQAQAFSRMIGGFF